MKKILLTCSLLMGLSIMADAQNSTKNKDSNQKTTESKTSESSNEARTNRRVDRDFPPAPADRRLWDPRKIYRWPDGQRATPSGHQAGAINDEQTLAGEAAWQMYLKQHPEKRGKSTSRRSVKGR